MRRCQCAFFITAGTYITLGSNHTKSDEQFSKSDARGRSVTGSCTIQSLQRKKKDSNDLVFEKMSMDVRGLEYCLQPANRITPAYRPRPYNRGRDIYAVLYI